MIPVKTLEDLGWPRLVEHLVARTHTARGRAAAEALELFTEPGQAQLRSAQTREARELSLQDAALPFGGIQDVREAVALAHKGGVLEPPDLVAVGETGRGLHRLRKHLRHHAEAAPLLADLGAPIDDLGHVFHPILESFDSDGRLADHASDELGPLRRRLAQARQQLERRMRELLDTSRIAEHLQDRYYTVRDDRYVVPVKIEERGYVKGIVHGTSQSGQTVFIEPDEVVDLGNRVRLAEYEVRDEERRILARLSGYVAEEAESFTRGLDATERLDLVAAAARLADDLSAHPATIGGERVELWKARHPLMVLTGKGCVANDIELERGRTLILSGPNAGGKTVTLKIVGLLALMARAGLHLPTAADSSIPWFRTIHSDIGDAQSLEQDLSTFSAHLMTLRQFLDEADEATLLLVDEVSVGTEPEQGAALAQSVLEALAERRATGIVTTHYERLKVLGASDPRFANASVGFDLERMEPTFRLHLGVPGSSGALAVARRLGLDAGVVERAQQLLGERRAELEELLADLADERRLLEEDRQRVSEELSAAEAARRRAERVQEAVHDRERRLREGAHDEAVAALRSARDELERVRQNVRRKNAERALRNADRRIDQLSSRVFEHRPQLKIPPGQRIAPSEMTPGLPVVVTSLGARGKIVAPPERGKVTVLIGGLRSTLDVDEVLLDIHRHAAPKRAPAPARAPSPAPAPAAAPADDAVLRTIDTTVDLRGNRVHDAVAELDRFIDQSLLGSRDIVFVIHGHGTGALRNAIRSHLAEHPVVTRWRAGEPSEGGDGVTIAWLDVA